MKRFHVHVHVDDLAKSIGFYSKLFAAEPARVEVDYAKWMLDDPRVNFAISTRGDKPGLDHMGFQGATTCCYARSEKHWVTDPQGIAWEHFHTLGNIPVFNESSKATESGACCAPAAKAPASASTAKAACCGSIPSKSSCC